MSKATLRRLTPRGRVIYGRNPLVEVIAAIKFPPLFALLQEYPTELQALAAARYPMAEVTEQIAELRVGASEQRPVLPQATRQFKFLTVERDWMISLDSTLLALTCKRYTRWEEFSERFGEVLDWLFTVYKPAAITRVGLRYKDIIDRQALGIEDKGWTALVRPEIVQSFSFFTDQIDQVQAFQCSMDLAIDPGSVRILFGTAIGPNKQIGLLIDTDCYVESPNIRSAAEVRERAERFHEYSGVVFQNCITDFLHDHLQPGPVS